MFRHLPSSSARAERRDGRRDRGASNIVTLVGVAAIVVVLLVVAGGLVASLWGSPFDTKTVDRSPAPTLLQLKDLAEYHAATGQFESLVDLENDVQYVPAAIAGEKVLYIGVGSVDAVVDFTSLPDDAVQVDPETNAVTVTLPEPTLGEVVLDIEQSHVAERDRGLLDRLGGIFSDNPTGEQDLQQAATAKIADAAAASGLVAMARDNTEQMLAGLFAQLGYSDVQVEWYDPTAP